MTSPNYTLFRFWSTLCIHSIRSTERTHFPKVKEQSAQSSDFLYLATNRLSQQHLDNLPWVYTTNLKHCTSTITNTYTTTTSQQFSFKSIPQTISTKSQNKLVWAYTVSPSTSWKNVYFLYIFKLKLF